MTLSSPLVQALTSHPLGLCGQHDPAKVVGSVASLEQRLNILTFGAVLDLNPLSPERWSALTAFHDDWLLDPSQAAYRTSREVLTGMRAAHLSGPAHIARVWWQLCRGVQGRFKGSWRDLLEANGENAHTLQGYLAKNKATFPVLAGPVISARWLDLVHRIGGVTLTGWETLSVPLPSGQVKSAGLFGMPGDRIHPLVSAALYTWEASCQERSRAACGLSDCPRRKAV